MTPHEVLPAHDARRRIALDRDLLTAELARHSSDALAAPYDVAGGPLGDFCESLHDLLAHVLMWDEINLAVLTEARAGRRHWSLEARWETGDAGRALNQAGVAAGRNLPFDLLLQRFDTVLQSLLGELDAYQAEKWSEPVGLDLDAADSHGGLAQYVMTVPNNDPYWHAAIHLRKLGEMGDSL
jgi:hypothetical protein